MLPRDVIPTKEEGKIRINGRCRIFPPSQQRKKHQRSEKKWLDFVRRQDYVPKIYHRLCIKHFVEGRPTKQHSYRECFPIITIKYKEPENIRPSISIQKMDKIRCQTSTCTKSSYSGDYDANGTKVADSLYHSYPCTPVSSTNKTDCDITP